MNFYYMAYRDQLVPTGELSNVGYPIMTNVPSSYRTGVEITASVRATKKINLAGNLTLSRNIIRDFTEYYVDYNSTTFEEEYKSRFLGDVNIAYSPGVVAASDISYMPVGGMEIHLISKYVGYQYFDNTSNAVRSLDPYFVNNLRIDHEFKLKKGTLIGAQLQVNNLFNSMYVSNAYGGNWYTDGVEYSWAGYFPQAGINYLARLFVRF
ncbi:MAG: TonB-dependent receptor [Bacteroidales bacterium]